MLAVLANIYFDMLFAPLLVQNDACSPQRQFILVLSLQVCLPCRGAAADAIR